MSMFNDVEWEARGNEKLCEKKSKSVAEYARLFPRGRKCGTELTMTSQTAEKMLLNFEKSGHPFFHCTSALEKGQLRSKGGGKTTKHFTTCEENVQLLLKMVVSVNQLSLPVASDQTEQEILVQPPIAEVPSNDERQGNLLHSHEQRFERLPEEQKLSKLCSGAGLNLVEVGQFFYALPSPKEPKIRSSCRKYAQPRENDVENCAKGWIRSNERFGPVLEVEVCKTIGGFRVEVKVPSPFEDQTTSWIKIVSGVEKCVREAMPIQEGEEASGRPAAKAKPILKPASTSNPNFIPMKDRRWIDIEVQKSKDQSYYQMSKFITNLLRHREVGREEDAGVPDDRINEKCKEKQSKDSRYWPKEVKQDLKMAAHWSAQKWIDVLAKGGGQKKSFQFCLFQMNQKDSCTFEPIKVIQEELILEMLLSILHCKTMYCCR